MNRIQVSYRNQKLTLLCLFTNLFRKDISPLFLISARLVAYTPKNYTCVVSLFKRVLGGYSRTLCICTRLQVSSYSALVFKYNLFDGEKSSHISIICKFNHTLGVPAALFVTLCSKNHLQDWRSRLLKHKAQYITSFSVFCLLMHTLCV